MDTICSSEMPRRAFMAVIAGGLLAAPLVVGAQQGGKAPHVGVLGATSAEDLPQSEGLRHGLRERGYVEGQNIVLESGGRKDDSSDSPASRPSWPRSSPP
jgi:hypothetical protein